MNICGAVDAEGHKCMKGYGHAGEHAAPDGNGERWTPIRSGIASQEYRDAASTATHELRRRLIAGMDAGFPITRATIESVAETLCGEYGGRVPETLTQPRGVES